RWISSGYSTFSYAVSTGMRLNVWKTNPSLRARRSARRPADSVATGSPSIWTSPDVGVSRQPMRFSSVVLPLPDGPAIARNSPRSTVRETPASAVTVVLPRRYVLVTSANATGLATVLPPFNANSCWGVARTRCATAGKPRPIECERTDRRFTLERPGSRWNGVRLHFLNTFGVARQMLKLEHQRTGVVCDAACSRRLRGCRDA